MTRKYLAVRQVYQFRHRGIMEGAKVKQFHSNETMVIIFFKNFVEWILFLEYIPVRSFVDNFYLLYFLNVFHWISPEHGFQNFLDKVS